MVRVICIDGVARVVHGPRATRRVLLLCVVGHIRCQPDAMRYACVWWAAGGGAAMGGQTNRVRAGTRGVPPLGVAHPRGRSDGLISAYRCHFFLSSCKSACSYVRTCYPLSVPCGRACPQRTSTHGKARETGLTGIHDASCGDTRPPAQKGGKIFSFGARWAQGMFYLSQQTRVGSSHMCFCGSHTCLTRRDARHTPPSDTTTTIQKKKKKKIGPMAVKRHTDQSASRAGEFVVRSGRRDDDGGTVSGRCSPI